LKPKRWGTPLVQEKYQEENVCDERHPYNNNNNNNNRSLRGVDHRWFKSSTRKKRSVTRDIHNNNNNRSLRGVDHRWFKSSTRKKRSVTRDIHNNNNNNNNNATTFLGY